MPRLLGLGRWPLKRQSPWWNPGWSLPRHLTSIDLGGECDQPASLLTHQPAPCSDMSPFSPSLLHMAGAGDTGLPRRDQSGGLPWSSLCHLWVPLGQHPEASGVQMEPRSTALEKALRTGFAEARASDAGTQQENVLLPPASADKWAGRGAVSRMQGKPLGTSGTSCHQTGISPFIML